MDKMKSEMEKQQYQEFVKDMTPTKNIWLQMLKAFIVGGCICVIGQFIINMAMQFGADERAAGSWCSLLLIIISVLLTGWNIYPGIVKWGGAGALVPITGFANSVAAPAIEYRNQGWVFGVGCKIFSIAGPVILYGIVSSFTLGVLGMIVGAW